MLINSLNIYNIQTVNELILYDKRFVVNQMVVKKQSPYLLGLPTLIDFRHQGVFEMPTRIEICFNNRLFAIRHIQY